VASVIDICNLALAHLGDVASVSSIDPPEGSAQAEHCARFYPSARDAMLEMHNWAFASRDIEGTLLADEVFPDWSFCYARPANALKIQKVFSNTSFAHPHWATNVGTPDGSAPFTCMTSRAGQQVILTEVENATIRYTERVEDTARYSPLFISALSHFLASMLAGPLLKGKDGAEQATNQITYMRTYLAYAEQSDSLQSKATPKHIPAWISDR
jgi:hypothetical protein